MDHYHFVHFVNSSLTTPLHRHRRSALLDFSGYPLSRLVPA
jgi:hypothetical protein